MKPIKLSPEVKRALILSFKDYLNTLKVEDGKVSFSTPLATVEKPKPIVCFTTDAYCKMKALVETSDKEIAWHGVVEKLPANLERPTANVYLIKDILVYPQTVTGATVTTDDETLGMWYMQQPDEIFENLRFQGHSHVHMATSPSPVDQMYYGSLMQTLHDDDYYIFMILNKSGQYFLEIYDFAENTLFEKADIIMQVITSDGTVISNWTSETMTANVKTYVAPITPTVTNMYNPNSYTNGTGGTSFDRDRYDYTVMSSSGMVWDKIRKAFAVPPGTFWDVDSGKYIYYSNYQANLAKAAGAKQAFTAEDVVINCGKTYHTDKLPDTVPNIKNNRQSKKGGRK